MEQLYYSNFKKYVDNNPTPLWKPFYYTSSEPFYSLVWTHLPTEKQLKFPSEKLLKEKLCYSKLDDELWELLQNKENCEYLKDCIIKNFLS